MSGIVQSLVAIAEASWGVFLLASPYILLGLLAAGALHVLLPADRVARWLGGSGLGATARAALLGIPLPLCSCGVVPVTLELSRKGASREASLAFLVSTPETGVDSVLLTWGLMGPVMAVARPLAALATSLVAALSSMLSTADPLLPAAAPAAAPERDPAAPQGSLWRRGLRHGLVSMVDEIGFWLVVGIVLTGVITALVPAEVFGSELARGPLALPAMLVLGVPLYMCASASTPVAAALVAKGIGPGAALVFLLAGPATNASSMVLIARFFGRRFLKIYLGSVALVALAAGAGLDALAGRFGWTDWSRLGAGAAEAAGVGSLAAAALLGALLVASVTRGAWAASLRDVGKDLGRWRQLLRPAPPSGPLDLCAARRPYRGRRHARRLPGAAALATRNLSASYPGDAAPSLEGIDLEVFEGSRIALVGPNGAGKSTLLKVVAGLLPPSTGEVLLFGHPAGSFHHRVAYLPQRSELDWDFPLAVRRLVLTGRYVHLGWLQRPSAIDRQIVDEVLSRLALTPLADRRLAQLSGGQQQRVLLGRALAQQADLLLLDEPLNAVDAETRAVIAQVLDELRRDGKTVLVATHDIGRLETDFDRAVYLSGGRETPPPPGAFVGPPPAERPEAR